MPDTLTRKLLNFVFLPEFHACLSKHEVMFLPITSYKKEKHIATVLQFKATLHLPNHGRKVLFVLSGKLYRDSIDVANYV